MSQWRTSGSNRLREKQNRRFGCIAPSFSIESSSKEISKKKASTVSISKGIEAGEGRGAAEIVSTSCKLDFPETGLPEQEDFILRKVRHFYYNNVRPNLVEFLLHDSFRDCCILVTKKYLCENLSFAITSILQHYDQSLTVRSSSCFFQVNVK